MDANQRKLHFHRVARVYDCTRDTDRSIINYLGGVFSKKTSPQHPVLDLATGTARYPLALASTFGIHFIGVDENASMLAVARRKAKKLKAALAIVQGDCLFLDGTLDAYRPFSFATMFNALHHFSNIPSIAYAIQSQLRPESGRCYFYTRVDNDNAETIWGKYFPGFVEREKHYLEESSFPRSRLMLELCQGGLAVQEWVRFVVLAEHTLDELLEKVRARHFSTFCAYTPDELEDALAVFSDRIQHAFPEARNDPSYRIPYSSPMTLVVCTPR